jgi:hypothetical protein
MDIGTNPMPLTFGLPWKCAPRFIGVGIGIAIAIEKDGISLLPKSDPDSDSDPEKRMGTDIERCGT